MTSPPGAIPVAGARWNHVSEKGSEISHALVAELVGLARAAQAREQHRLEMERHAAQLAKLKDERARMLVGRTAAVTPSEVAAIAKRIESAEREVAFYRHLMTEPPRGAAAMS